MNAAYWASQKVVVTADIRHLLHNLENLINADDKDVNDYIDEIYPPVNIAGGMYQVSNALKNLDETKFKELKDAYEEDICTRISEAVCEVLDNENGEVVDDYLPFSLKLLLRQYVSVCSNLYRSDN